MHSIWKWQRGAPLAPGREHVFPPLCGLHAMLCPTARLHFLDAQ